MVTFLLAQTKEIIFFLLTMVGASAAPETALYAIFDIINNY